MQKHAIDAPRLAALTMTNANALFDCSKLIHPTSIANSNKCLKVVEFVIELATLAAVMLVWLVYVR